MSYATMCCVTAYYSVLPLLLAINLAIGALYNELGNRVKVPGTTSGSSFGACKREAYVLHCNTADPPSFAVRM